MAKTGAASLVQEKAARPSAADSTATGGDKSATPSSEVFNADESRVVDSSVYGRYEVDRNGNVRHSSGQTFTAQEFERQRARADIVIRGEEERRNLGVGAPQNAHARIQDQVVSDLAALDERFLQDDVDDFVNAPSGEGAVSNDPDNFYVYDAEGNLESELVFDDKRGGYVSRTFDTRTAAEIADDTAKETLRSDLLGNLSQAPADRIAAYQTYTDAVQTQLQTQSSAEFTRIRERAEADYSQFVGDVERRETDVARSSREDMARRGLFGSSAYVDAQNRIASDATREINRAGTARTDYLSDLTAAETRATTDIATTATIAGEDLAARDRDFWQGLLGQLSAGASADTVTAQNQQRLNLAGSGQSSGITQGAAGLNLQRELGFEGLDLRADEIRIGEDQLAFARERARTEDRRYGTETFINTAGDAALSYALLSR